MAKVFVCGAYMHCSQHFVNDFIVHPFPQPVQ